MQVGHFHLWFRIIVSLNASDWLCALTGRRLSAQVSWWPASGQNMKYNKNKTTKKNVNIKRSLVFTLLTCIVFVVVLCLFLFFFVRCSSPVFHANSGTAFTVGAAGSASAFIFSPLPFVGLVGRSLSRIFVAAPYSVILFESVTVVYRKNKWHLFLCLSLCVIIIFVLFFFFCLYFHFHIFLSILIIWSVTRDSRLKFLGFFFCFFLFSCVLLFLPRSSFIGQRCGYEFLIRPVKWSSNMFGASGKICACEIQTKRTVTEVCQFHFDFAYESYSFADNDFIGHLCFLQLSLLMRTTVRKKWCCQRLLYVFSGRDFRQSGILTVERDNVELEFSSFVCFCFWFFVRMHIFLSCLTRSHNVFSQRSLIVSHNVC